ncbi:hypothetical protein CDEST_03046 [Colletotrichum destructivum]|uniref:Uncharacterized protein n=1 Tax=Colletotrichum destructivum TaxID=34406 RepID=A0AAX4I4G5_9PEZI|nr:hypothetical protein CDEST_03046 [Colletotrichum destructivum]
MRCPSSDLAPESLPVSCGNVQPDRRNLIFSHETTKYVHCEEKTVRCREGTIPGRSSDDIGSGACLGPADTRNADAAGAGTE